QTNIQSMKNGSCHTGAVKPLPIADIGWTEIPQCNATPIAAGAAGRCSLKCHTLRRNELQGVDKAGAAFFHHQRSGAPVALIGLKGIRCDSPFPWRVKSGAAPATVGGESFFRFPLAFPRQT